jgi:hypothetical protein
MIVTEHALVRVVLTGLILAGSVALVRADDAKPTDSVKTTGPRVAAGVGANGAN